MSRVDWLYLLGKRDLRAALALINSISVKRRSINARVTAGGA